MFPKKASQQEAASLSMTRSLRNITADAFCLLELSHQGLAHVQEERSQNPPFPPHFSCIKIYSIIIRLLHTFNFSTNIFQCIIYTWNYEKLTFLSCNEQFSRYAFFFVSLEYLSWSGMTGLKVMSFSDQCFALTIQNDCTSVPCDRQYMRTLKPTGIKFYPFLLFF